MLSFFKTSGKIINSTSSSIKIEKTKDNEQALHLGTLILDSFTKEELIQMIDDATCLASTHPMPELPTDEKLLIAKMYHFRRLLQA